MMNLNIKKKLKSLPDFIDFYKTKNNKYKLYEDNQIELRNKKNNNNYANCSGIYYKSSEILNDKAIYINPKKDRFIGWAGNYWCLTGTQWLDIIFENQENGFGGFHSSINGNTKLSKSEWENYEVFKTKKNIEENNNI